ncbi:hypothetical protein MiSe_26950 [Microseira wollei NIES-4236]|uniref:Uncharacterized protein n=1 Tax=Microseira wollei NIES-4236 TaxID=2530354 RepID=A0AAV3X9B6_9CYAN|nr:hypothetical protein MiSe_26950 [Microseira wollei NIES-4236]
MNENLSDQTPSAQNLVATLFCVAPEELQNNPEASRAALVTIYTKLG